MSTSEQQERRRAQEKGKSPLRVPPGPSTYPPYLPGNTPKSIPSDAATKVTPKIGYVHHDARQSVSVVEHGSNPPAFTKEAGNDPQTFLGRQKVHDYSKAKLIPQTQSSNEKESSIGKGKDLPSTCNVVDSKVRNLSQRSASLPLVVSDREKDIISLGKHPLSKSSKRDHQKDSQHSGRPAQSSLERRASEGSPGTEGKDLIQTFQTALADLGQALNTFISKDDKAKATSAKMNKSESKGRLSEKVTPSIQAGNESDTSKEGRAVPADTNRSDARPTLAPFCPPAELLGKHPSSEETKMVVDDSKRDHPSKKSHGKRDSYIIKPTVLESPEKYLNDHHETHPRLHTIRSSKKHSPSREEALLKQPMHKGISQSIIDDGLRKPPSTGKTVPLHHRVKHPSEGQKSSWKSDSGQSASPSQGYLPWNGPGRLPDGARNPFLSATTMSSSRINACERGPLLARSLLSRSSPSRTPSPDKNPSSSLATTGGPRFSTSPLRESVSDGGGSGNKAHRQLQFRKRQCSSVQSSTCPSFSDLLRIASHNTGKGDPKNSDVNPGLSRKRRHSDSQLSRFKGQQGGHGRPHGSSTRHLQKMGNLSEPEHSSSQPASFNRCSTGVPDRRFGRMGKRDGRYLSDTDAGTKYKESGGESALSDDSSEWPQKSRIRGPPIMGNTSGPKSDKEDSIVGGPSSPTPSSYSSASCTSPSASVKKRLNLKKMKVVLSGRSLRKHLVGGADVLEDGSNKNGLGASEEGARTAASNVKKEGNDPPHGNEDPVGDGLGYLEDGDDVVSDGGTSSDSDDSFLMDKPSALIEETTALLETPMPVTPLKSIPSFQPSPVSPGPTYRPVEQKASSLHYTLDKILHIETVQKRKYGDVGAIRSKLKDSVSSGGFAKLAESSANDEQEDVEIDPSEYAGLLECRLDNAMEKIPELPPGEEIFHKEQVCQLFTPTQCLHDFQKMSRANGAEDLLGGATTEEIEECIKSGFLECYYHGTQAPQSSMLWMFRLMSTHPSCQESSMLYDSLQSQLEKAPLWLNELDFPWMPTVKDVITVLLNYGGDIAGLVSVSDCDVSYSLATLRELDATAHDVARRDDVYCQEPEFFITLLENQLGYLLKILAQAIITHLTMKNCSGYRTEELQCLLIVMLRIALDKHILGHPVIVDISNAVSTIIEGFEDVVWYQQVERLCILFPLITGHHHNMVYLLQNCIPLHLERGRYLYRMLGYAGLQKLVFPEKGWRDMTGPEGQDIKVSSLIPILHCCKPSKETDYYQLNSTILLLDCSIGNETLTNTEKRDLEKVIRRLREMVGDIRENALSLSRSQVKSLIVRTAAKLSFMTQSMVSDKEGIFGFLGADLNDSMDLDMNPELHISSQADPVSDGDESTGEMEVEEGDAAVQSPGLQGEGSRTENKASKPDGESEEKVLGDHAGHNVDVSKEVVAKEEAGSQDIDTPVIPPTNKEENLEGEVSQKDGQAGNQLLQLDGHSEEEKAEGEIGSPEDRLQDMDTLDASLTSKDEVSERVDEQAGYQRSQLDNESREELIKDEAGSLDPSDIPTGTSNDLSHPGKDDIPDDDSRMDTAEVDKAVPLGVECKSDQGRGCPPQLWEKEDMNAKQHGEMEEEAHRVGNDSVGRNKMEDGKQGVEDMDVVGGSEPKDSGKVVNFGVSKLAGEGESVKGEVLKVNESVISADGLNNQEKTDFLNEDEGVKMGHPERLACRESKQVLETQMKRDPSSGDSDLNLVSSQHQPSKRADEEIVLGTSSNGDCAVAGEQGINAAEERSDQRAGLGIRTAEGFASAVGNTEASVNELEGENAVVISEETTKDSGVELTTSSMSGGSSIGEIPVVQVSSRNDGLDVQASSTTVGIKTEGKVNKPSLSRQNSIEEIPVISVPSKNEGNCVQSGSCSVGMSKGTVTGTGVKVLSGISAKDSSPGNVTILSRPSGSDMIGTKVLVPGAVTAKSQQAEGDSTRGGKREVSVKLEEDATAGSAPATVEVSSGKGPVIVKSEPVEAAGHCAKGAVKFPGEIIDLTETSFGSQECIDLWSDEEDVICLE